MDEKKPATFRFSSEVVNDFRDYAQEYGYTNEEAMRMLLNAIHKRSPLMELNLSESYCKSTQCFLDSMKAAEENFAAGLKMALGESKDVVLDLQAQLKQKNNYIESLSKENVELADKNDQMEEEKQSLMMQIQKMQKEQELLNKQIGSLQNTISTFDAVSQRLTLEMNRLNEV